MMNRPTRSTRRRTTGRPQRRGFSLIEIIVALTLLAFAMMSAGQFAAVLSRRGYANELRAKRIFVLQQQANKLTSVPFDSLNRGTLAAGTKRMTSGGFSFDRILSYSATGTQTLRIKLVVKPVSSPTQLDSIVFARTKPKSASPLCVGCAT